MGPEIILGILTIILTVLMLLTILAMIVWLLIHKQELRDKTDALNRPLVLSEPKVEPKEERVEERPFKPSETPESTTTLRSTQSLEELEKLQPQTLMAWKNEDIEEDTASARDPKEDSGPKVKLSEPKDIEIRKLESEGYTSYFPPDESKSKSESEKNGEEPEVVAFEGELSEPPKPSTDSTKSNESKPSKEPPQATAPPQPTVPPQPTAPPQPSAPPQPGGPPKPPTSPKVDPIKDEDFTLEQI